MLEAGMYLIGGYAENPYADIEFLNFWILVAPSHLLDFWALLGPYRQWSFFDFLMLVGPC
jgi:hypothetical protein